MTNTPMTTPPRKPDSWKLAFAIFLDLVTAFVGFGLLVGWLAGGLTPNGFSLDGIPAAVFYLLIIAYFIVFNKYLGGTIWRWILGARPAKK